MQRWRGTPLAKLQVSSKKEAACAKRWQRFHAKVLDATMINLPEHASSDFVAELSDLMSDQAWWDAVEEKRVDMLNDRAKDKAGALPPPTLPRATVGEPSGTRVVFRSAWSPFVGLALSVAFQLCMLLAAYNAEVALVGLRRKVRTF